MHLAQLLLIKGQADAGQVNCLAPGHAGAACGPSQQPAKLCLPMGRNAVKPWGEQFKGQRLQGVAGQQGAGLAELHMHRGFAAAQHIVVHAGHVVMHQRIGVDEFYCAGRPQGSLTDAARAWLKRRAGNCLGGGQHQQRAQALAAVKHRIAHALNQCDRRLGLGPCERRHSQPLRQGLLDLALLCQAPGRQVEASWQTHSGAQVLSAPWSSTLI